MANARSRECEEDGDRTVDERPGKYTSKDIHRAIFGSKPPKYQSVEEMDDGIADYLREKYARHG